MRGAQGEGFVRFALGLGWNLALPHVWDLGSFREKGVGMEGAKVAASNPSIPLATKSRVPFFVLC